LISDPALASESWLIHNLFRSLYFGDRQPPLYHLTLWLTIRAFGDGEFAVRLPTLIAGTLVIPVLYELGRELYDRRTGLIAATFAAASPLLVWYSQEVRMYTFATLFGLLALLTQLRAIRNGTMGNWAVYILATAALLWSHYFGLLLIAVQQLVFVGVLVQRKRSGEPVRPLALGFAYSGAVLVMQLVPLFVFAHHQYQVTSGVAGSPSGTYDYLSFYSVLSNIAWSLWGYQPNAVTVLLAAMWPLFLLGSLVLLGRGGSRQTMGLAAAAIVLVVLLIAVSAFDRSYFEVRNFLILVPLVLLLIARLITGWIRQPRARLLVAGGVALTLLIGLRVVKLEGCLSSLLVIDCLLRKLWRSSNPGGKQSLLTDSLEVIASQIRFCCADGGFGLLDQRLLQDLLLFNVSNDRPRDLDVCLGLIQRGAIIIVDYRHQ